MFKPHRADGFLAAIGFPFEPLRGSPIVLRQPDLHAAFASVSGNLAHKAGMVVSLVPVFGMGTRPNNSISNLIALLTHYVYKQ